MSYCFICGQPTPGSLGKCQACVEKLALEEHNNQIQRQRAERRLRFRLFLKLAIISIILASISGLIYLRVVYSKEWDKLSKQQDGFLKPYMVSINRVLTDIGLIEPVRIIRNGFNQDDLASNSFTSKNFSSGGDVLKTLKNNGIDCVTEVPEANGIVLGNEVVYLKCDGSAAVLYLFENAKQAQEGLLKINEMKRYALVNQVGNTVFAIVSAEAHEKFDKIRTALAPS